MNRLAAPFAAALALSSALLACAPPRVDFSEAARRYAPGDYNKVQERWTRNATIYEGVNSVAFLTATLKSWDWRQAYLARATDSYALTPAEQGALREKHRSAFDRYHEVFVSVSTTPRRWNDLDKKKSRWKLALVNEAGDEVIPDKVERLRVRTPELAAFFPYHDPFSEAYVLRFPKRAGEKPLVGPSTRKLTLRLAGAPGRAEVHWEAAP